MKKQIAYIRIILVVLFYCGQSTSAWASEGVIKGKVMDSLGNPLIGATVYLSEKNQLVQTDSSGLFVFTPQPIGTYNLVFYYEGLQSVNRKITLKNNEAFILIHLEQKNLTAPIVHIRLKKEKNFGRTSLGSIENFGIYEGKKTEVIEVAELTANTATNNPRQVYAKITGLNIWESDGAGLQLGIGGRGLSPNRTANFNVRQNGYDISADALGYPESYYTPPIEALERIELVRGAASLQFGTQFGGMLNFKFKKGNPNKKAEVLVRQTIGSWGFHSNFTSLGGTSNNGKWNYYLFFQYKTGQGFRPFSQFSALTGFSGIEYNPNSKLKLNLEITKMDYTAQQPGGLTDKNFEDNPRQSFRNRNWFNVEWNMAAFNISYKFNDQTQLNIRNFGLLAQRNALGNLERINVVDLGGNRTLISGKFQNIGNENRLIHKYKFKNQNHALLVGTRIYKGFTSARQGNADNLNGPSFNYLNPEKLENSNYLFTNTNYSVFAENIFRLHDRFTLTPGIRYEYINTRAEGYYFQRVFDGAGNLVVENKENENLGRARDFVILGLGANYNHNINTSLYANISQNYRAINFSDIRVLNPNLRVDPKMKDETGYTFDFGIKKKKNQLYNFEITAFLVRYNNKIGQVLRTDQAPLYLDYRFRTNISDARNVGLETFAELNILPLIKKKQSENSWTFFVNCAYVDARYISTQDNSIKNKRVEMVPPLMLRTGSQFSYKQFKTAIQIAHVATQFSDATNAIRTATAVEGIIPSYQVVDLSLSYKYKKMGIDGSINNVLNQMYFTRRAEGYPGPGIIPSDGRGFYLTLSIAF